jgi:hypothetical protein
MGLGARNKYGRAVIDLLEVNDFALPDGYFENRPPALRSHRTARREDHRKTDHIYPFPISSADVLLLSGKLTQSNNNGQPFTICNFCYG